MSPVSFLPSHVYREAQLNRMQGKAGRVSIVSVDYLVCF